MKQRHLGRSGLVVSRLALGTMTWGRDTDEDDAAAQLAPSASAGGTLVDTANTYCGGESERVLGRLLGDVVPREEVARRHQGVRRHRPDGLMQRGTSRGHLLAALDASLRRLRTDHVDLWQLHAWDPVTPWEETLAALDAAVASGKVRYAGVSQLLRLAARRDRGAPAGLARARPAGGRPGGVLPAAARGRAGGGPGGADARGGPAALVAARPRAC